MQHDRSRGCGVCGLGGENERYARVLLLGLALAAALPGLFPVLLRALSNWGEQGGALFILK